ncbi:unnamed protein product [Caenorhabditis auriculariae]|uniref:glutaminase n=1 Tax=Caenorhabditis auriculariae TaxID=2777116 RepID=A0A8S1HH88_9PELO|nr:unnamed protein product [Caenorhabditis auriculariae]
MYKVPSERTLETLSEILEKKMSTKTLSKSLRGLSNPYEREESSASSEDMVYNLFKIPGKEEASFGKLLTVLKSFGLREDDPRLRPMMERVRELENIAEQQSSEATDQKHWKLEKEDFKDCVGLSLDIVCRALQNDLVIPRWSPFVEDLRKMYRECAAIEEGQVATYIPQLARQSPKLWGVSLCTVDGQRAFNYAIVASDLGADVVHSYVGQEPSGRLFNEICLDSKHKPHNPMVNSGAIIITSLIKNKLNMADRFDFVLQEYRKIAGNEYIGFDNATFLSERASADRNYALAYYMKENKCFPPEVIKSESLTDELDFYFQLCSIEANCESLSVMAATLANGGVCPITNETCINPNPCRDVLSLMYSCGMYDASGQFSFSVGLPAKSGVSGAMIVVVPNVLGLCLFSPPLDKLGNSFRGVSLCKKLISRFNFHNYDCLVHSTSNKIDPRRRDIRERDRIVPVFHVARAGDLAALRRLYMQGEDLNLADYDKRTALHIAAAEGFEPMVKFLVNVAKVDVVVLDRWNRTPLDEARFFQHDRVARFLEKAVGRSDLERRLSVSSVDSNESDGLQRPTFGLK